MPHATSMPSTGFQAIILCGPGVSLNTFTSNPEEFPKALVPIANRPMVWYPLDWCYRFGVTKIHLITPSSSAKVLDDALSQNPHLTSLPLPRADIIAPEDLTHTSGTAEILRLSEVQAAVSGDFIVLPCDLVCEIPGESLLDSWMMLQSAFGGSGHFSQKAGHQKRSGGLGVWFETKGEDHIKGAETDFLITTSLPASTVPQSAGSLRPYISKLLYATTTDTLRDLAQEKGGFPIRTGLIRNHGRIRMLNTYRDAHLYFFPHWVLDFVKRNDTFDSISEDVVGWWAKANWQNGLARKLNMDKATELAIIKRTTKAEPATTFSDHEFQTLSSTHPSKISTPPMEGNSISLPPPMLSYVQPRFASHLVRRVDNAAVLLSTSLRLAALPPLVDTAPDETPTPLSHPSKIATDPTLIATRTTIDAQTTLIAPNTSIANFCTIKSSCIGANCGIAEGAKISSSLLMDGVQIESKVSLHGCILGRRCVIGRGARLDGCEVQEGFRVEDGTVGSKGEKFCVFEGLENGLDEPGEGSEATIEGD